MKLNWKSFVSGIVMGSVFVSGISYAAPKAVKLFVNGSEIHSEVAPRIVDGSTLIPARALAEALGANVIWDGDNQTVVVENEAYRQHQRKSTAISERDAAGLAADAQKHYWYMSSGGGGDRKEGAVAVEGQPYPYRWMGSDLDSKEKFIAYVEQLYTPEQADVFWKKQTENGSLALVDGKLAQPDADGGSMMAWGDAAAKLVKDGNGSKTFLFHVPLHDKFEDKEIKLRYVQGKGWRIDEPVDAIR